METIDWNEMSDKEQIYMKEIYLCLVLHEKENTVAVMFISFDPIACWSQQKVRMLPKLLAKNTIGFNMIFVVNKDFIFILI